MDQQTIQALQSVIQNAAKAVATDSKLTAIDVRGFPAQMKVGESYKVTVIPSTLAERVITKRGTDSKFLSFDIAYVWEGARQANMLNLLATEAVNLAQAMIEGHVTEQTELTVTIDEQKRFDANGAPLTPIKQGIITLNGKPLTTLYPHLSFGALVKGISQVNTNVNTPPQVTPTQTTQTVNPVGFGVTA